MMMAKVPQRNKNDKNKEIMPFFLNAERYLEKDASHLHLDLTNG